MTVSRSTVNSPPQVQIQNEEKYLAIRGFSDLREGESGWKQDRFRLFRIDRSLVCWTLPQHYARGRRMKQLSPLFHFSIQSAWVPWRGSKLKLSFQILVIAWLSTQRCKWLWELKQTHGRFNCTVEFWVLISSKFWIIKALRAALPVGFLTPRLVGWVRHCWLATTATKQRSN